MVKLSGDKSRLTEAWDQAAGALESDPMRPVRYKKCFRYLSDLNRESGILEIGCGEGSGLQLLRNIGFRRLVGVEVSAERLRKAKNKLEGDIELILVSPSGALPFKTQAFDAVVSAAVIEHIIDPGDFAQEIARIVRPGGYVVISSDCYAWRILQLLGIYHSLQPIDRALFPTTLLRYFRKSGLKLLHYEGFPLPGRELRSLRLFVSALFAFSKRVIGKLIPSVVKLCMRRFAGHPVHSQASTNGRLDEALTFEPWSRKLRVRSFLKLIFSDENVFFLTKQ